MEGKTSGLGLRGPIARTDSELAMVPGPQGSLLPICKVVGQVTSAQAAPLLCSADVRDDGTGARTRGSRGTSPSAFLTPLTPLWLLA